MGIRGWLVALAALTSAAAPSGVQAQTSAPRAAVRIEATMEADALRFERRPEAELRIVGCPTPTRPEVVERRNLPAPVEPGVEYRGARIEVRVEVPLRLDGDPRLADELAELVAHAICPAAGGETEAEEDG